MRPGVGVVKRSPMQRPSKPLKRRTPLRSHKSPIPMSARTKARIPERQRVRARVFERDGGCVLRRLDPSHRCMGGLTFQHVKKASQGGEYSEENGVALCWYANSIWVEQNRAEAEALGLHKPGWVA